MALVIESLAFDGLLVAISDELSEVKFTELTNQYDVPESITDKFRKLQYIKNHGNLNLEELVEKLSTLGCKDLSDKAGEILTFQSTKRDRRGSAAFVFHGQEPRETQPDEISPGDRKKGQSDGNETELGKDSDEPIEEIPCVEPTDNDKKYMDKALELREKSNDPKTKVGSVLVHPTKGVIGEGYNRMPLCNGEEMDFPWTSIDSFVKWLDTKYGYVVHSAITTLIDATETHTKDQIRGSILYTTLLPGNHDAQLLVEYGIAEIVFLDDIFKDYNFMKASKRIMKKAKIKIRQIRKAGTPSYYV